MRESKRIATDQAARLHPNDWSSIEVRVLDCSDSGFRAACEAVVRPGSLVTLEVPGLGPVEAQVSWRRGSQFGAKFLSPIDLAVSGFRPVGSEKVLARLLVQRADARRSGLFGPEQELRRAILAALPVRRGPEADPAG